MNDTVESPASRPRVPKWAMFTVLGLVAAVALFFGAIFFYTEVIKDNPDKLTTADLDAALAADTTLAEAATAQPPVPSTVATSPGTTSPGTTADTTASGTWVATPDSVVGYRIKEVLFGIDAEGVGRTNVVDGTLSFDGTTLVTTDFTVDMATITSDDSRRDGQFRGRIMSVDEFPTATFTLTEPIELGTEPVEGAEAAVSATGDLTLRGVTNSVTFDLTAKVENGKIGVLGAIPVVFADYGIANPSTGGITTEDHGLLEFVLVFEPA